eukprot:tig00020904_g15151.t1
MVRAGMLTRHRDPLLLAALDVYRLNQARIPVAFSDSRPNTISCPWPRPQISMYIRTRAQLKDLKAKARIFVPKGALLMGVLDEAGALEEGEVFVQFRDPQTAAVAAMQGPVVVCNYISSSI